MLSIKPIISVENGVVENADRVRTRAKARERCLELLTAKPLEQATVLHTTNADIEEFHDEVPASVRTCDPANVQLGLVGAVGRPAPGPGVRRRGGDPAA